MMRQLGTRPLHERSRLATGDIEGVLTPQGERTRGRCLRDRWGRWQSRHAECAAAPASGRPAMSGEPEHPAAVLQVERLHSRARLAGTTWWPVRARGEGLGGAFEITLAMPPARRPG